MNSEKMTRTIHAVSALLRGRTKLFKGDFRECIAPPRKPERSSIHGPPYQGTTYGADKRYAAQLRRETLIETLHFLNRSKVPYILSYDGQTGEKTYGDPLPCTIEGSYLFLIHAGRSTQATLSGLHHETIESIYASKSLNNGEIDIFRGHTFRNRYFRSRRLINAAMVIPASDAAPSKNLVLLYLVAGPHYLCAPLWPHSYVLVVFRGGPKAFLTSLFCSSIKFSQCSQDQLFAR